MIDFNPKNNCYFCGSFYIVPQCMCIRNHKSLKAAAEDIGNRKAECKQHRIMKYLIAIALAIAAFP